MAALRRTATHFFPCWNYHWILCWARLLLFQRKMWICLNFLSSAALTCGCGPQIRCSFPQIIVYTYSLFLFSIIWMPVSKIFHPKLQIKKKCTFLVHVKCKNRHLRLNTCQNFIRILLNKLWRSRIVEV